MVIKTYFFYLSDSMFIGQIKLVYRLFGLKKVMKQYHSYHKSEGLFQTIVEIRRIIGFFYTITLHDYTISGGGYQGKTLEGVPRWYIA